MVDSIACKQLTVQQLGDRQVTRVFRTCAHGSKHTGARGGCNPWKREANNLSQIIALFDLWQLESLDGNLAQVILLLLQDERLVVVTLQRSSCQSCRFGLEPGGRGRFPIRQEQKAGGILRTPHHQASPTRNLFEWRLARCSIESKSF